MHLKVKVFQIQGRCPCLIYLLSQGHWTVQSPFEVTEQNQLPVGATKLPVDEGAEELPDLLIVEEPVEAQINANEKPLWLVECKEFYQGRVDFGPYLILHVQP